MSAFVPLYPTLPADCITTIKQELTYQLHENSKVIDLQTPGNIDHNTNEVLLGHDTNWSANKHAVTYLHEFKFNSDTQVFGQDGVAPSEGVLHVCLRVFSADSNQRFLSSQKFTLTKETQHELISLSINLTENQFYGRVFIVPVVLTTETLEYNTMYAKSPGMLLGELCRRLTLVYDGSGSSFPIITEKIPNAPLWRFVCNFEQGPRGDLFTKEHIALCINEQHEHASQLQDPKSPLFHQILCAWHTEVIFWVKEQEPSLLSEIGDFTIEKSELIQKGLFESGSIADYLYEFIKNHGIIVNKTANVGNSIRKYMSL